MTTASTRRAGRGEKIARSLTDDVWVVAPEDDQSGVAHSLSLTVPLRLRESPSAASPSPVRRPTA